MEEKPTPPPAKPSKPRRRWFQYSLRTVLILTTVCAVLFAWWSHKARQQREAVAVLESFGGYILYDFNKLKLDGPPLWPKWLVDALGVDYFATVLHVYLDGRETTDLPMEHLKSLPALRWLRIDGKQVTDSSLEHLKDLTSLEWLSLQETEVTDDGIERLRKALPNCEIYCGP